MQHDDGPGLFSYIDRTCAADPLGAGTYFVQVVESGNDSAINSYILDLAVTPCCAADMVLADQTVSGTAILQATSTATLGPNLTIDGVDVEVRAPAVSILGGTTISGGFSISINPTCP